MAARSRKLLSLTIAGKADRLAVRSFYESLSDAIAVLSDIDAQVSSIADGSLEWRVVSASTNSPLTIEMEACPKVAADYSERVVDAFFNGLNSLEGADDSGAGIFTPAYFTPKAMQRLANMNRQLENGVGAITFSDNSRRYSPTRRFIDNVAAIIKKPEAVKLPDRQDHTEAGAIEGTVDNLFSHNQLYFCMFDVLTGRRIHCDFDKKLQESVRKAWQKRVTVSGDITYGPDGTPKRIKVQQIQIKDVDNLPQFKGHFIDITGGIESSEYVRGLRND